MPRIGVQLRVLGAVQHRVAVAGLLVDEVGRDRADAAGFVLEHDLLAQRILRKRCDGPSHHIGRAARAPHDDPRQVVFGKALGVNAERPQGKARAECRTARKSVKNGHLKVPLIAKKKINAGCMPARTAPAAYAGVGQLGATRWGRLCRAAGRCWRRTQAGQGRASKSRPGPALHVRSICYPRPMNEPDHSNGMRGAGTRMAGLRARRQSRRVSQGSRSGRSALVDLCAVLLQRVEPARFR